MRETTRTTPAPTPDGRTTHDAGAPRNTAARAEKAQPNPAATEAKPTRAKESDPAQPELPYDAGARPDRGPKSTAEHTANRTTRKPSPLDPSPAPAAPSMPRPPLSDLAKAAIPPRNDARPSDDQPKAERSENDTDNVAIGETANRRDDPTDHHDDDMAGHWSGGSFGSVFGGRDRGAGVRRSKRVSDAPQGAKR